MTTREAMEMLVKSLKEMKEDFEKQKLQKAMAGASAPSSPGSATVKTGAGLHTRDKSKMQVNSGKKPTMATAFQSLNKEEEMEKGAAGAVAPSAPKAGVASGAGLHTRDKSKMQVNSGKKPTMATAFQSLNKEDNSLQESKVKAWKAGSDAHKANTKEAHQAAANAFESTLKQTDAKNPKHSNLREMLGQSKKYHSGQAKQLDKSDKMEKSGEATAKEKGNDVKMANKHGSILRNEAKHKENKEHAANAGHPIAEQIYNKKANKHASMGGPKLKNSMMKMVGYLKTK